MTVRDIYRLLIVAALAGFLHLLLSWEWTLLAALAGGYWFGHGGWLIGAAGVGMDYLVFLIYNYAVDARAVSVMTETMGALLGNMPSAAVVAFSLLIGVAIGAFGGAAGTQLRRVLDGPRREARRVA